jgi:DNA-binding transcriptional LysR family regulator
MAKLEAITWAEAGRLPLCLLSRDMQNRRIIEEKLEEAGGAREPMLESNSLLLLYAHVRRGDWASIIPARFVDALDEPGRLRAIPLTDPVVTRRIGLVLEKRDTHSPLVEALKVQARRVAFQIGSVPE